MEIKILVADDEEQVLDVVARFMEFHGYRVDVAESVNRALELMQKNEYDIIVTDKNMPDAEDNTEGGMTLLRYAKKHMPSAEVIMMTGYATIETAVEAMKVGAFDYIMKPVPLNELKEKIDRILEYRNFIDSETSLRIYKTLHNELLNLLENRTDIPEEQLQQMLRTLGSRIDQVFGMQKGYETIIQVQSDALEKIESYAEALKDALSPESPYYSLAEKIYEESKKKI